MPHRSPAGGAAFDAVIGADKRSPGAPTEAGTDRGDRNARADSFAPLLQTRFEAESVLALFEEELGEDAVLLTKAEATKAAFHQHAPGKRYLHVATHGWFASETIHSTLDARVGEGGELWSPTGAQEAVTGLAPMTLCGLAFAGANQGRDSLGRVPGILTAEELAGIDLSACELAVLSACETNVGIRRAGQVAAGRAARRGRAHGDHVAVEGGRRDDPPPDGALLHLPLGREHAEGRRPLASQERPAPRGRRRARLGRLGPLGRSAMLGGGLAGAGRDPAPTPCSAELRGAGA